MMRCALGANGKADLADQLAGCATAADAWARLDALLADAVLVVEAPLDVRDPGASELLRAKIANVAKSAAEHPDRLYVVETPEGYAIPANQVPAVTTTAAPGVSPVESVVQG